MQDKGLVKKKTNTETLLDQAVQAKAIRMEHKERIDQIDGVFGKLLRKQFDGETTESQDLFLGMMLDNYRYSEDVKIAKKEVFKKIPKPPKPQYNYPGGVPPLEVRKGLKDGSASDEEKKKAQEDYDVFMTYARGMVRYKKGIIVQRRMKINHEDLKLRTKKRRKKNKTARKARRVNRKG